jgi:hypothetical protein
MSARFTKLVVGHGLIFGCRARKPCPWRAVLGHANSRRIVEPSRFDIQLRFKFSLHWLTPPRYFRGNIIEHLSR